MCIGKVQSALSEQDKIRGRAKCGGRYDHARHLDPFRSLLLQFTKVLTTLPYITTFYYAKLGR